jgi:hypothetical protein
LEPPSAPALGPVVTMVTIDATFILLFPEKRKYREPFFIFSIRGG